METPAPRFAVDAHLGRLARYLRMMGYDAWFESGVDDARLEKIVQEDERVLLSRDRALLDRLPPEKSYEVQATAPRERLFEVVEVFDLRQGADPLSRCLRCNSVLTRIEKEDICERLPSQVRQSFDRFQYCAACDQIYWKGSHYERMRRLIDSVLDEV